MNTSLHIDFCGAVTELGSERSLLFGRGAELDIDDNPFLHRHLGQFRFADGVWWLENVGTHIPLTLVDADSPSRVHVAPRTRVPLAFATSFLRFECGSSHYEIELRQPELMAAQLPGVSAVDDEGKTTVRVAAALTLNEEQRLLLAALALHGLRATRSTELVLPSNVEAAQRLGWTLTKFNRKLDYLCKKLEGTGMRGLVGSKEDGQANQRRHRLVRFAIDTGMVTAADIPSGWR